MEKKSESKRSRAATAESVAKSAPFDVDSASSASGLLYGTRVATIGVSVVGMLFCAVFWPSVLDFKAKLSHKPSLEEFVAETSDVGESREPTVNEPEGWREQLDALYPREVFSNEGADVDGSLFPEPRRDDSIARASRFNDFEPGALPLGDSVFDPLAEDESPLTSPVDEASVDVDASLPVAPRAARSSYASISEGETTVDEDGSGDDPLLADLPPVDPDDPLGLDQPLPEAPRTGGRSKVPAPSEPELPVASVVEHPVELVGSELQEEPVVTENPNAFPVADSRTGVSTARYDSLANPDPGSDAEQFPGASGFTRSTAYAAPVEEESPTQVAAPVESDARASFDVPTSNVESVEKTASETEKSSALNDVISVADAVFAPSYFSRAVGLYGGQNAFSSLYFARAAKLVSDSGAWSPDSFSRVTPILPANSSAPTKDQRQETPEPENEEADEEASEAASDSVSAEALHAKYPTLVGYVEHSTIKSPTPLPVAEERTSASTVNGGN